jgi:hypothetical protein
MAPQAMPDPAGFEIGYRYGIGGGLGQRLKQIKNARSKRGTQFERPYRGKSGRSQGRRHRQIR